MSHCKCECPSNIQPVIAINYAYYLSRIFLIVIGGLITNSLTQIFYNKNIPWLKPSIMTGIIVILLDEFFSSTQILLKLASYCILALFGFGIIVSIYHRNFDFFMTGVLYFGISLFGVNQPNDIVIMIEFIITVILVLMVFLSAYYILFI